LSLAKGENRKIDFLETWKILQNIVFLRKNLWELLEARDLHIFESAQNSASLIPFAPNLEENFFQLFKGRDGADFLEVKSSNKIETDQYFKKHFFIN
jgi:hypothetical protein